MNDTNQLTHIDREKNIFPSYLEDEIDPEEKYELYDELYDAIISDEINEIIIKLYGSEEEYRESFMSFQTSDAKLAREWINSKTSIRYYKGKFYHLSFESGMNLRDMFKFERWGPEEFSTQVERWIAGDKLLVKQEKKKSFIFGLAIGLLIALFILLFAYGIN